MNTVFPFNTTLILAVIVINVHILIKCSEITNAFKLILKIWHQECTSHVKTIMPQTNAALKSKTVPISYRHKPNDKNKIQFTNWGTYDYSYVSFLHQLVKIVNHGDTRFYILQSYQDNKVNYTKSKHCSWQMWSK